VPDFFDVVHTQRAARTFLPEDIDDETVARILTAATHAPSAENNQPYVFVVVRDPELRATIGELTVRPLPTIAIGATGGLMVGLTSVGAGSLMIVLLLFVYPLIGANQLVGTDLTQAVPLTAAAALGAVLFGHPQFGVTASIIIGSVPAVLIGSYFSSRAPDRYIRPIITFVIFASGLKYVGVGTTTLGWILAAVLAGGGAYWLAYARPRRAAAALAGRAAQAPAAAREEPVAVPVPTDRRDG